MIGDVYRVDVRGEYQGQTMVVTFAYKCTVTWEPGLDAGGGALGGFGPTWRDEQEMITLVNRFKSRFETILPACSVTTLGWGLLRVSRFTRDITRRMSHSEQVLWTGALSAPGVPSGVSGVIIRRYAYTGSRKFRGHISIPGLRQADVGAGLISGTSVTWDNLTTLAGQMRQPLSLNTPEERDYQFVPVIGNLRTLPPIGQEPAVEPLSFTRVRARLGTQRSRLPGHGRNG